MNVANQISATTTQVSGAVTLVSASSSKTASLIAESSPDVPRVMETASKVIINADTLALCSFVVMVLSFVWNIYSTRRRNNIAARTSAENIALRERELAIKERELELRESGK